MARPVITNLSSTPTIILRLDPFFGPSFNQRNLTVLKGNPDLEPAKTHNFDASFEWYDNRIGVVKLGAFYKRIDNLLETVDAFGSVGLEGVAGVLPSDPRYQDVIANPDNYDILIRTPVNSQKAAEIWGFEVALEKQFTKLPGALSGLGIYANYTFSDSSKQLPLNFFDPVVNAAGTGISLTNTRVVLEDVPFNGQAKHSGSVAVTYNKYGFDGNVAYTHQGRRINAPAAFYLHDYEEAFATLDARLAYDFEMGPGKFKVFVEGSDLLRGAEDSARNLAIGGALQDQPKYIYSRSFFGGRQLRIGFGATF